MQIEIENLANNLSKEWEKSQRCAANIDIVLSHYDKKLYIAIGKNITIFGRCMNYIYKQVIDYFKNGDYGNGFSQLIQLFEQTLTGRNKDICGEITKKEKAVVLFVSVGFSLSFLCCLGNIFYIKRYLDTNYKALPKNVKTQ